MRKLLIFVAVCPIACGDVGIESEPDAGTPDSDFVDTRLESMTVSRGELTPAFDPNHNEYSVKLGLDAIDLTVGPTVVDDRAAIEVDGLAVASGDLSPVLELAVGENLIEIVVSDEDGNSMTYTLRPDRGPAIAEKLFVKPSTPIEQASFGSRSAIDGETLVVAENGTPLESETLFTVFTRNGSDYSQTATVPRPDDVGRVSSISLHDGRVAIGFAGATVEGVGSAGEVLIYRLIDGDWVFRARIVAPVSDRRDFFGRAVLLRGENLYITALQEDSAPGEPLSDNSAIDSGAVFIYRRGLFGWLYNSHLKSPETSEDFGETLAISGDTLLIGGTIGFGGGRAYIFEREAEDAAWTYKQTLRGRGMGGFNRFGSAIAIEGTSIVVGDPAENVNLRDLEHGAIYWFGHDGTEWVEQGHLTSGGTDFTSFGTSVALCDGAVAVGENSFRKADIATGRVRVYGLRDGAVRLLSQIEAAEQVGVDQRGDASGDLFGSRVYCDGERLYVSAPGEDSASIGLGGDVTDNSMVNVGALYIFH